MKTDAERGIELLELPHVLNLQLMRFVYDMKSNSRKKVHSPITFPLTLDLTKYCTNLRGDAKQACASGAGEAASSSNGKPNEGGQTGGAKTGGKKRNSGGSAFANGDANGGMKNGVQNGNGHAQRILFDLEAVVLHSGTKASEGHYIAYARGGDERLWWKYDDGYVSSLRADEFFGTPDAISKANKKRKDKEVEELKDRIKNKEAYMLIYKRRLPEVDQLEADVEVPANLADPIRQKSKEILEVCVCVFFFFQ